MEDKIPYRSLGPALKNMRIVGFCALDPNTHTKTVYFVHGIYCKIILVGIIVFIIQQIIKIYQVRDDIDRMMDTIFLMLTYTHAIYKQVIFIRKRNEIDDILESLKSPLFDQNMAQHRVLLSRTARNILIILRVYSISALWTCLLWVVYPFVLHIQKKPAEFSVWLPFNYSGDPEFYYAIIYVWIQTSWLAYGNTSYDSFITSLYAQCKTQIAIFRIEIKDLVKNSETEALTSRDTFVDIFNKRFKKLLRHFDEIVTLIKRIENVFGLMILYFFMVAGWVLCTSAYKLVTVDPATISFASMVMYLFCMFLEMYIYCFFGNEVAFESEKLMESAFSMDWHKIPAKSRYPLIIFMERIKRPIVPTAGSLIPLSNNTFVSILRSSYTFYTFLKNSRE